MSGWKKILCAVDASAPSSVALDEAVELATQLGASLTVVHVHRPIPSLPALVLASPRGASIGAAGAGSSDEVLEGWRLEAERRLGAPVETRVLRGDPAGEIDRIAREERFDLLVVGSHEGAGLGRLVLGSVADRVTREAPCPVLVARRIARPEAEEVAAEVAMYH
jgi:nucleotide-binding universal stress UspA family protein